MFLADADRSKSRGVPDGTAQLNAIEDMGKVGHFHISDHARTHASDLCPGSYHFFEDYRPWLELAGRLMNNPEFSGVIAVEMEACGDLHEVTRAISRTRNWLRSSLRDADNPDETSRGRIADGIVLAADIVNSTEVIALGGVDIEKGAQRINLAVSNLCETVQQQRGSVYSFTGDGVVAIFEFRDFADRKKCVEAALNSHASLFARMKRRMQDLGHWSATEEAELGLRASLHAGEVVIPNDGPLKHQVLGSNVIIACRLLADVDKISSRVVSEAVCSGAFHELLGKTQKESWIKVPDEDLRDSGEAGSNRKGLHWSAEAFDVNGVYAFQPLANEPAE